MLTRRKLFSSVIAGFALRSTNLTAVTFSSLAQHLTEIERTSGGRLGVAILDTATGALTGHRTTERFPMCSTFKLLAASAVLARVDRRQEDLSRIVRFTQADILAYAPVTSKRIDTGISIGELCAAAITVSDNTAANLLLATLGGPAGLTAFVRTLGDQTTRLDRIEPDLNSAIPGDPRDTTTPAAMVTTLRTLLVGTSLSAASRAQLTDWLLHCTTGLKKLRAGIPSDWRSADKTGSGANNTSNDIAILWPPNRAPILAAVYLTGATLPSPQSDPTIASVGREIAAGLHP